MISAECEARVGDVDKASLALNTLLEKRWQRNEYVPILQNDRNTLLEIVLLERRKQLLKRGLRWSDLRRLNKDSRFAKVLTREIEFDGNIETYELRPNDVQYTYPIPLAVIEQQAYEQNPI
ncbi:RagB/SusD family nutrient uptake outer membrane protein [Sphingobacterium phlebotomi]|uniref:RagB/SusD family nutrient uptake outer membrane protein n=1 Tax=Sphingobacterium phlebotomi TaxID=2605433 RepID=UPI0016536BA2|nr:RagB/SusD family nutrient uptake outer membrane protein [Sphingobacterium phlebotomi]